MTEDEAKTKWCPFARVGADTTGLGSLNRDHVKGAIPEARCIGPACMVWRVIPAPGLVDKMGYCGLAGAPQ